MTAITKITNAMRGRVPSAPVLIGGVYSLCVLAIIAISAGSILVTNEDPFRSDGPVEEIVSIGVAGTTALVVGVLAGLALVRSPRRARVGAIVFGALAIITLGFFWSGAPGIFAAVAAWLAGLTRGRRPLDGAPPHLRGYRPVRRDPQPDRVREWRAAPPPDRLRLLSRAA